MRMMRSSRKFLPQLNHSTNKSQSVCCSGGRGVNTEPKCSKTVSVSMQQASAAASQPFVLRWYKPVVNHWNPSLGYG